MECLAGEFLSPVIGFVSGNLERCLVISEKTILLVSLSSVNEHNTYVVQFTN